MPAFSTVSLPHNRSGILSGAWLIVVLLFIIGALNYLDRTMITTMRESIVEAVPMSDAEFGLLSRRGLHN